MAKGYVGMLLRINLSDKKISKEPLNDNFMRKYMGGKGLISYYLMKEVPPSVDAYSEKNKLIFATGVLTGVPVPGFIRFAVGAKSPLTGGYGQSEAGGFWGPELKKAGYDAIIVEGKSQTPVYIDINDGEVFLRSASHLWGSDTGITQDKIREELGDQKYRVAQIGVGGESLVRYACITNELKHFNGRCGLGAVMGSKNLKAIAVRGTGTIEYTDQGEVMAMAKWYNQQVKENPLLKGLSDEGTPISVNPLNAGGILPTENFKKGYFEKAENFSGPTINNSILKKHDGCLGCSIRCKTTVAFKNNDFEVEERFGGLEYETIGAFGSACCVDDLQIIAKASELCNKHTIDTISAGMTIAFAMECFENGLITLNDTDGIELKFGNGKAMLEILRKIIKKEGIGKLLAEGANRAAEVMGKGAEQYAMTIKNQELPLHDPRGKVGIGIGYAISDTGADHMHSLHDGSFAAHNFFFDSMKTLGFEEPTSALEDGPKKVRQYYTSQMVWGLYNLLGACAFTPAPRGFLTFDKLEKLITAATGWDMSLYEMMKATERTFYMSRLYNSACGFESEDDKLPERLYQPLENGALEGVGIDKNNFAKAIRLYYGLSGWDETTGYPKYWKAMDLRIEDEFLEDSQYKPFIC